MNYSSSSLAANPEIFFREGVYGVNDQLQALEIICLAKACLVLCSYEAER